VTVVPSTETRGRLLGLLRTAGWFLTARPARADTWDRVRIAEGKIEPPYGCEIDVVDHCNRRCLDCNHGSPAMKRRFADPESVFRTFSVLAKAYRPAMVKVLGGEPLLHPDLAEVLRAIRRSGISEHLLLVTNGLLLPHMPDRAWDLLDEVALSIYPDSHLGDGLLRASLEKGARHGVKVSAYAFDRFNRFFALRSYRDPALTGRVYRSCRLAHEWGCHSIRDGHFFKCPQAHRIAAMAGLPDERGYADGVEIRDSPGFVEDLRRYLLAPEPLDSCRSCLGTSGKARPHVMARPGEWLSGHDESGDDLIDFERLARAEARLPEDDDVKELLETRRRPTDPTR
jgi:GTP 3',8-cyclase